jgi:hypothetical protein
VSYRVVEEIGNCLMACRRPLVAGQNWIPGN